MSWVCRDARRARRVAARDRIPAMTTTSLESLRDSAGVGASGADAISLRGVRKSFGSVEAVRGIDLTVRPGEIVAFLGPNGAGKTSTIDMVLGLSTPTAGEVSVFGMEPYQAIRRGLVSAVMQTGGLLKDMTVRETATYTASLFAQSRPVDEALARAGITDIGDRLVGKCSGGEQPRLRFALALLSDPELVILDEPTTGMDVESRRSFWAAIREDAERGRTVLFATHYLEEADSYADRIVLVRKGLVVGDGTPAQIKAMAAGHPARRDRGDAARHTRSRGHRGARRHRAHPLARHRRGRAPPAHHHRCPRPGDHRARPRGRLRRPDRRRRDQGRDPMTTTTAATTPDQARLERAVPSMGGFSLTLLRLELRRLLRNRRAVIFTVVM